MRRGRQPGRQRAPPAAQPGLDGSSRPLAVERADRLVADHARGGRVGGRPDEHPPGRRRRLQAAGGVHRRRPSPCSRRRRAAAPTSTSPVLTPMRICDVDARADRRALGERLLHPQRGPHRPLGVVLVGIGAPNRATMASPMILSTRPPKASMSATRRSKQPSTRFLTCSGSSVSDSDVKPTRSANSTRDDAALVSARRRRACPHSGRTGPLRARLAARRAHHGASVRRRPTGALQSGSDPWTVRPAGLHLRSGDIGAVAAEGAHDHDVPPRPPSATPPPGRRRRQGLRRRRHRGARPRRRHRRVRSGRASPPSWARPARASRR